MSGATAVGFGVREELRMNFDADDSFVAFEDLVRGYGGKRDGGRGRRL